MNAAKETTLNEVAEVLSHILKHIVTKEDVRSVVAEDVRSIVVEEVAPVLSELTSIRRELDDLGEKLKTFPASARKSTMRWNVSPPLKRRSKKSRHSD